MLLLVADTSGKQGSIALAQVDASLAIASAGRATGVDAAQSEIKILETVPLTRGAFSAELIPQLASLIRKHGKNKNDLDSFVVVPGPGSFTGLRVGLAAIKGLGEALGKPIVAISLLEAVAASAGVSGRILAALDAGRGDIYAGDYAVELSSSPLIASKLVCRGERLVNLEEFIIEANSKASNAIFTPDADLAKRLLAASLNCRVVPYPTSATLATLGFERLRRGETISSEALEANYIRRSDAEIFAKPAK
jgi:tRNA threonylcarbamoyladenosine biosynthesis protein TsaB